MTAPGIRSGAFPTDNIPGFAGLDLPLRANGQQESESDAQVREDCGLHFVVVGLVNLSEGFDLVLATAGFPAFGAPLLE